VLVATYHLRSGCEFNIELVPVVLVVTFIVRVIAMLGVTTGVICGALAAQRLCGSKQIGIDTLYPGPQLSHQPTAASTAHRTTTPPENALFEEAHW
jgi:hypothetical protein